MTQNGSFPFQDGGFNTQNRIGSGSYDARGNLLKDPSTGYACNYDILGQLAYVNSGSVASYIHGADGQRVRANTGSAWRESIYFGGALLAQKDQTGTWTDYIRSDGKLLARTGSDGLHCYNTDNLGSTRQLLDGVANPSTGAAWNYAPFGEDLLNSQSNEVITFTGHQTDYETGLQDFGARFYSSSMGRFMSPDPSRLSVIPSNPQTWNRYAYVMNSPLSLRDDNGKWPTKIHNQIIDKAFPNLTPPSGKF
jgi:RHS repeat-associated protein